MEPLSTDILPVIEALETENQQVSIDYGGSLIKVLYRPRNKQKAKEDLVVAVFSHGNLDDFAEFLKKNVNLSNCSQIQTTGVGMKKDGARLEQLLGKTIVLHNEMDCFNKSIKTVLSIRSDEVYYKLPHDTFLLAVQNAKGFAKMTLAIKQKGLMESSFFGDDEQEKMAEKFLHTNTEDLYTTYGQRDLQAPALVVMCSSGIAMMKYKESGRLDSSGYSSRGGRTLMGLGALLTGAKDYEEMIQLAENGDHSQLDILIKHLKSQDDTEDFYSLFPDENVCFNFGHGYGKKLSDFRREDLAAAVINLMCSDIAQSVLAEAIRENLNEIVLCGTMINHEVVRKAITLNYLTTVWLAPVQPVLRMCKLGPHLGTIGAWIYGNAG